MQSTHKVLLVTSSGGGGLLQAAKAKEQEIVDSHPNAIILERDVMKHWMWKPFGSIFVALWNRAQIRGDVKTQSFFGGAGAIFAEYIFWPHIFICSLYTLFKEKIDRVIDTQIMGTSAILKAIRIYNKQRGKNVVLEKVLVDLPTKKATHFFVPIKSLSAKDRSLFRLVTIAPLLQDGESEEEFWNKNCRLTPNELRYEDCYVRRAFRKAQTLTNLPNHLHIRTKGDRETNVIQSIASKGSLEIGVTSSGIECFLHPDTCMITVLLGSQPASSATLQYIDQIVKTAQKFPEKTICLFVFAAEFKEKGNNLFAKIIGWVQEKINFPKNLTLLPMSFQQDDVIAPLFVRSDATCTRSGGQTAMELIAVSRGKIWIHSEAKGISLNEEQLLDGIPGWESANAAYLVKMKGASLITPQTIAPFLEILISQK